MINRKFLIILFASFFMSGCASEIPDKPAPVLETLYYHGPEINKPFLGQTDEPDNGDSDIEDKAKYFSILNWLPFEEKFPEGLPIQERLPGADPAIPDNLPDPSTRVTVDVLLDFEEELLLPADSDPPVNLPVTGNGEVWGQNGMNIYATNPDNRFKILMDGWQVDNYTVSHYDAHELDALAGVGMHVSNQAWYWVEKIRSDRIPVPDLPLTKEIADDKKEPITQLGLQFQTASSQNLRRGLYLNEIVISRGNDTNANNNITIQNNPDYTINNHPDRGGRYDGWAMIINGYLPNNEQLIIRNGDEGIMQWPNGTNYAGRWKDDKRHGNGTLVWPDGKEYNGNWVNGVIEGEGRLVWPNGMEYYGEWRNGRIHGKGTLTWFNNQVPVQIFEGRWVNGRAEGRGSMTFDDGRRYVGSWREGTANGAGSLTWPDGQLYTGDFSEGRSDGQGTMRWPDNSSYSGEWQDGSIHGRGTWVDEDGTPTRGRWDEGQYVR